MGDDGRCCLLAGRFGPPAARRDADHHPLELQPSWATRADRLSVQVLRRTPEVAEALAPAGPRAQVWKTPQVLDHIISTEAWSLGGSDPTPVPAAGASY